MNVMAKQEIEVIKDVFCDICGGHHAPQFASI